MTVRATIRDVAAAAGVSGKTVSRVLNNERYVGAETREKVHAAVAALGFRPGPIARAFGAPRGPALALACAHPDAQHAAGVQAGALARCAAGGGRLIVQPCDPAAARPVEDLVALVETCPLDGMILTAPLADDAGLRSALAQRRIRTVAVSPADPAATPSVGVDDARAAAVMTLHLLALGHRRIGFVGGNPGIAACRRRADGHRAALAAAGIAAEAALFADGRCDFASGARAAGALLELADPPTAIFAADDAMAAGVLSAAHARGLRLPEDLSVVGFGDDPLAGYVWPPLTTIRAAARDLGWHAADLLLGGDGPSRVLPCELVERGSSIGIGA